MNPRAILWLALFVLLTFKALGRSSWGIALYMLTFFALPAAWWWGQGLLTTITDNWNLVGALLLAVALFLDGQFRLPGPNEFARMPLFVLFAFALNATLVHFLFADSPQHSWTGVENLWKNLGLVFLMLAAIRDRYDFKVLLYSLSVGAALVGWAVVFEGQGSYVRGRLENVSIACVAGSNAMGAFLSMLLPLGGYLLVCGNRVAKCVAALSLILALEVVLRCESRGAFLGLAGGTVWFLVRARGPLRKYAVLGVLLAAVAVLYQVSKGQQTLIVDRFRYGFASEDERDPSAQGRLDYWRQGLKMLRDHPFGSGDEAAFKSDLGLSYIRSLGHDEYRSVHNGYLNVATSWGVQGLLLYVAALLLAWRSLRASNASARALGDQSAAFLGLCLEAGLVTQLIAVTFGGSLASEWVSWWIVMAVKHKCTLLAPAETESSAGSCLEQPTAGTNTIQGA